MNDFTTKLINCLVSNQNLNDSIQELFRSELEKAVNDLLRTEMTGFLKYEKYDRQGFNTGNSRNGTYERKFQTTHGELNLVIPRDKILSLNLQSFLSMDVGIQVLKRLSLNYFKQD